MSYISSETEIWPSLRLFPEWIVQRRSTSQTDTADLYCSQNGPKDRDELRYRWKEFDQKIDSQVSISVSTRADDVVFDPVYRIWDVFIVDKNDCLEKKKKKKEKEEEEKKTYTLST